MKGNMDLQETLIDGELMYRGNFIEVRKDRVRLPDGAEASREYVVHPGAVAVLALLDNGNLVMERQYRYPAGREFLEIPAGKIDPAEDGLSTGQRELLEETGYVAREWTHLTTTWPCIGYADERIEYYLARGLTRQQQNLDHGEFLEVFEMPLTQGIDWIREGKINDSKTIIGLLWLEKHLKGWQV
ncbi:MAG: NUDIX hydrolase [Gallionella sp.]|nr:NUDIX hydrolase [Gallionella sp.]MDD4947255.1 NUDIX hydrolase [Gallionella sp.]MDD5612759.1 NUDIX hydrolase [Gallionella sp.]